MSDTWSAIQALTAKALMPRLPGHAEPARYAHDKAARLVRAIDHLAPAIGERIDRPDLTRVAALYASIAHNAAPAGKTADDQNFSEAAELAADQLKDLLPPQDLDLVLRILAEHRRRDAKLPEAKLLADALAIEEFGLVGLWNQTRLLHAAGKSLEQLIKLWKAQHDYGYWESRLRDGFHYETSRKTAKDRLAHMKGIYDRLQKEFLCEDLATNPLGHY